MTSDANKSDYQVEFNYGEGTTALCCITSAWTSWLGLPLLCGPCIYVWASKTAQSQTCKITDKQIEFKSGWLGKTDRWIALDRIQNVSIEKPFLCGCTATTVAIQTAGGGGPEGNEGTSRLVGVKDAVDVRNTIIRKRDAFMGVIGGGEDGTGPASGERVTRQPGASPQMIEAIVNLTNAVQRLEKRIDSK
ncbi:hypothetical protein HDV05_004662 [Chytridiales sp. JEL 0842]|nr:hypothetical protein HDV05_004662 [Chytridiales sp. JEL 0842]